MLLAISLFAETIEHERLADRLAHTKAKFCTRKLAKHRKIFKVNLDKTCRARYLSGKLTARRTNYSKVFQHLPLQKGKLVLHAKRRVNPLEGSGPIAVDVIVDAETRHDARASLV